MALALLAWEVHWKYHMLSAHVTEQFSILSLSRLVAPQLIDQADTQVDLINQQQAAVRWFC